ncbi:LpxL/LpxP family Kdo(2)-lipid IV(A) lauroyl/palmitoleoyl acyltransferase [Vibrio sp. T187]|uniref:LpxL/LpxP family Kdo(2)-lipid IV(A) lauroyl/palmitoleoyl acyltransferase n=1 Tax=Vibrio TaxID=662 RepID=UPI0010C940D9|nr:MULTISPECIES: LpxL/LpxP family Kdo(2)-lipid IV(A) lauroyl/palmitoleoyl acyltransferase [Vibrio]MBW3695800.1 LpxL/LpxP family Kdo(2)-lipid IV(A) lauroyl/palmitoleoyl acyltransferase [Vibrio sp. T187]
MKVVESPAFTLGMLAPKYWCIWLSFGLLAILVNIVPYRVLIKIGYGLGSIAQCVLKRRAKVAYRNFELSFPELKESEVSQLVKDTFRKTGLAVIETGMAWFWPDWRVKRHVHIQGQMELLAQEYAQRGVLVVCGHFLNLEMTARIFGLFAPGYGVYRAHSNPVYEFIQHRGRTRKGHKMIDRSDIKSMIRVLKTGKRLWYLPDHDYGAKSSVFVPFFGVEQAATTSGTGFLIDMSGCAVMSGVSIRKGRHYHLEISEDISSQFSRKEPVLAAKIMNQEIERMIEKDVSSWMWLHKRFKTRPEHSKGACYYSC